MEIGPGCGAESLEDNPNRKDLFPKETRSIMHKRDSRLWTILFDQGVFTVYKQLFLLSFGLNTLALLLSATGHFPYAKQNASLFAIGNIFASVLCRSEAFLRIVFWLAVKLFGRPWVPISIKTMITSFLQSIGGLHSSCGVSSISWLTYSLLISLYNSDEKDSISTYICSSILAIICISTFSAFPLLRHLHHNVFERTHRFAGWTSLVLVWVFVVRGIIYESDPVKGEFHLSLLFKAESFWFTLIITNIIVLPWLSIRRVQVNVSSPSGHASLIKFHGGVKTGLIGRISRSPLSEWHAFGIISNGEKEHMMLVGAVGDFTKSLVSNPPTHLWVRKLHFAGLPYLVNLYQKVVLVATGSGISVFLSFMLQPSSRDVCLVWIAKGIEQNYGKEIMEMVSSCSREKIIVYDSAVFGRPKVADLSVEAAINWGAEVVIVTSNPQGTRDVVTACKAAGIPAFGPIWDS